MRHFMVVVALASVAVPATAATIRLDYRGVGNTLGQGVTIRDSSLPGGTLGTRAGELRYRVLAGGTQTRFPVGTEFLAYCTDIRDIAGDGMFDLVGLQSAPRPGQAMGPDRARLIANLYSMYRSSITDDLSAAAFQLAIWEIANEDTFDATAATRGLANLSLLPGVGQGEFWAQTNPSARNLADQFLDGAFAAFRGGGAGASLLAAVSPTDPPSGGPDRQDVIIVIPLPSAAGLGLAGLALVTTRRRR